MILADWGADVIKVESLSGDHLRTLGLVREISPEHCNDLENPYFDTLNANKRFVSVNSRTPDGIKVIKDLIKTADVFVTNFRDEPLRKMGIDYETISKEVPGIIYGVLLGYGDKGEEKDRPGFDFTAGFARAGTLAMLTPYGSEEPITPISALGDSPVGMSLAAGLCAALVNKARTGKGDKVSVSLYGNGVFHNRCGICEAEYGKEFPVQVDTCPQPLVNLYKSADGRWFVLCISNHDKFYNSFVKALGHEELVDHPVYATYQTLLANEGATGELIKVVKEIFAGMDGDELYKRLSEYNLPFEIGYNAQDIMNDPQARVNDFVREVTYPTGNKGIVFPSPVRYESAGLQEFVMSKPVGAHNDEVLSSLGYEESEIADLRTKGCIK